MKVFLVAVLIASACVTTRAFSEDELHEIFCSFPNPLAARLLDCIIEDAPESISKATAIAHQCINKYWDTTGTGDSLFGVICYPEIVEDPNVIKCVKEKGIEQFEPSVEELKTVLEKTIPCMAKAK